MRHAVPHRTTWIQPTKPTYLTQSPDPTNQPTNPLSNRPTGRPQALREDLEQLRGELGGQLGGQREELQGRVDELEAAVALGHEDMEAQRAEVGGRGQKPGKGVRVECVGGGVGWGGMGCVFVCVWGVGGGRGAAGRGGCPWVLRCRVRCVPGRRIMFAQACACLVVLPFRRHPVQKVDCPCTFIWSQTIWRHASAGIPLGSLGARESGLIIMRLAKAS